MESEENDTLLRAVQNQNLIYAICILLFISIFLMDIYLPLGVAAGVPYISVILVSLWISKRKFTVAIAIISSILTIAGFYYSPMGGEMWKVLFNRSLALFAIWTTAILTLQRKKIEADRLKVAQDAKKLLEETKVLRGLLPICASCKKIRDDKGYWNQIEVFIEKHSDAHFSHGICQECQDKLYGDQDWYKNKKKKASL